MLALTHVLIAISSLIYSSFVYFSPSRRKIIGVYAFVSATVMSGTALTIATHSPLLSVCLTGLFYLGVTAAGIILSYKKLAKTPDSE